MNNKGETMKRTPTTAALAAKEIRKELKTHFPETKFRVTSSNYSMGNSVDIKWIDGPTNDEVRNIVRQYQYGHFNGMEDIYEVSNRNEDIPQVKFVMAQRDLSNEFVQRKAQELTETMAGLEDIPTDDLSHSFTWNGQYLNWHQLVHQKTYNERA